MNAIDGFIVGMSAGIATAVIILEAIEWMFDRRGGMAGMVGRVEPTISFPLPPAESGTCKVCLKPRAECEGRGLRDKGPAPIDQIPEPTPAPPPPRA